MSYSASRDVEISSLWDIEGARSLHDTLTVSPSNTACTLENVVKYETCVHLICNNNIPCELKIKSSQTSEMQITQIAIVSEAKILELYGKYGEYLTTTHADFIDEFEDMTVYMAVLQLPENTTDCSIKFAKLKNKDQMWMYGINVVVEKCQVTPNPKDDTSVNFENVNKILRESGHQLTEKAEKCKKFLQLFDSSKLLSNKPPDPQVLVKMFESAYLPQGHPFGEQAKNMTKCFADLWPGFALPTKTKVDSIKQESDQSHLTVNSNLMTENIKQHIDQCFHNLEERLMNQVDEKLKELENKQNEKFNLILMKLDNFQQSLKITENNAISN